MNENLKTRREHLKVLPLQKRLQAMENIRKSGFPKGYMDTALINFSLLGLFSFHESKQGADYWWKIESKYFSNVK